MVRYRRNFVPGGTYFFTVTLADRTSSTLVDHIGALRMAFRITRHDGHAPRAGSAWRGVGDAKIVSEPPDFASLL